MLCCFILYGLELIEEAIVGMTFVYAQKCRSLLSLLSLLLYFVKA